MTFLTTKLGSFPVTLKMFCTVFVERVKAVVIIILGRNTTTLSTFIGCIDLIDVHQISPKHPRNNDKGKCVRKFWYLKYLSHGVHLCNISHIFFSYSNLRCQYLLNQSEYRKSLTHTCWSMPFEWDCAAILLMQQHPMPEKFNRRTLGHFMPYWLLTLS